MPNAVHTQGAGACLGHVIGTDTGGDPSALAPEGPRGVWRRSERLRYDKDQVPSGYGST
jgi:hypothetical protein